MVVLGDDPPKSFRGTVHIGDYLGDAEQAIRQAREVAAQAQASTRDEVLRMIKKGYSHGDQGFHQDRMVRTVRLIWQLSHDVCNIPGYDVSIEGHWVKGHADVVGNDRADMLSKQARKLSRNLYVVGGKGLHANLLPSAVHIPLFDEIEREASRHRPAQAQPAQHGHGCNGIIRNDLARIERAEHGWGGNGRA